jgi:hypothetical protein
MLGRKFPFSHESQPDKGFYFLEARAFIALAVPEASPSKKKKWRPIK